MRQTKKIFSLLMAILMILLCFAPAAAAEDVVFDELNFDVVFAIDGSESMLNRADTERLAIEASKLFVDMCEYDSSRVGYVLYTHRIEQAEGLMDISDPTVREEVKQRLESLRYRPDGFTDIALGLTRAKDFILESDSLQSGRNPLIILLSDGNTALPGYSNRTEQDSDNELQQTLDELAGNGIPVYAIGLNKDGSLDHAAMEEIAQRTGGADYATDKAEDLPDILSQIFAQHISSQQIALDSFTGDGESHDVVIPIPNNSVYEANIIILSGQQVSDLHLFTPEGGTEVAVPSANVILSASRSYTLLKIIRPIGGDWILSLVGADQDDVIINLLYTYDMTLMVDHNRQVIRNGDTVSFQVYMSEMDQKLDASIFDDSEGILHVEQTKKIGTGEGTGGSVTLAASEGGLVGDFAFGSVGTYLVTAEVNGMEAHGFHKTTPSPLEIQVLPLALEPVEGGGDKNILLFTMLNSRREYALTDLVSWDNTLELSLTATESLQNAPFEMDFDGESLIISAQKAGQKDLTLLFRDEYGQELEYTLSVRVVPLWLVFLLTLLILSIVAAVAAAIWWSQKEKLEGTLTVYLDLPDSMAVEQYPPEVHFDLTMLRRRKGKVSLKSIVETRSGIGGDYAAALNPVTGVYGKITLEAKNKNVEVQIPPGTTGCTVHLDDLEVKGGERRYLSGKTLSINCGLGYDHYVINLNYTRTNSGHGWDSVGFDAGSFDDDIDFSGF